MTAEWRLWALAAAVRLLFFLFTDLPDRLENRIEIANSQIGIKAVREAIYLLERHVPIYQNKSMCQPSPLIVGVVRFFQRFFLDDILFIALDMLAALLIYRIIEALKARAMKRKEKDVTPKTDFVPILTSSLYLFNPFAVMTCLGRSSSLFSTVACLAATYLALKHSRRRCMAALALATLLSCYPIALIVPLIMILVEGQALKKRAIIAAFWNFVSFFFIWCGLSWYLSAIPFPSPDSFLEPFRDFLVYATPLGCNCTVSDMRPNLGLAWYLFVEMFDHFRAFFLAVFQLNIFVFLVPAAIKFRSDPVMLLAFLLATQSIFKPYPTLSDSVLLVTFLSFPGLSLLRRSPVLLCYIFAMITFSLLGPINWYYWMQRGSGNANFFYAITLVYSGSHIVLVLDVTYRWMKRDIQRRNPGVDLSTMYQY